MSQSKFRAGVLFGPEVREVLEDAKSNAYALPAVNCIGTSSVNAALIAARDVESPIIIQFSNGGAHFFIGKGSGGRGGRCNVRRNRRMHGRIGRESGRLTAGPAYFSEP